MPDNFNQNRNISLPLGETKASSGFIVDGQLWITGDETATVYSLGADDTWEAQIQFSQYNEADPAFMGVVGGRAVFFGRTTGRLFIFDRADGSLISGGGEGGGGGGGEQTVGPALDLPASNWASYTMSEALVATGEYGFVMREDASATRTCRTTRLLGLDLIGLTAQADANYAETDPNVRSVGLPRITQNGASVVFIGMRNEAARQLYVRCPLANQQIVRMVRYL